MHSLNLDYYNDFLIYINDNHQLYFRNHSIILDNKTVMNNIELHTHSLKVDISGMVLINGNLYELINNDLVLSKISTRIDVVTVEDFDVYNEKIYAIYLNNKKQIFLGVFDTDGTCIRSSSLIRKPNMHISLNKGIFDISYLNNMVEIHYPDGTIDTIKRIAPESKIHRHKDKTFLIYDNKLASWEQDKNIQFHNVECDGVLGFHYNVVILVKDTTIIVYNYVLEKIIKICPIPESIYQHELVDSCYLLCLGFLKSWVYNVKYNSIYYISDNSSIVNILRCGDCAILHTAKNTSIVAKSIR